VSALAFSPDGTFLASGGEDGMIVLWDVPSLLTGSPGGVSSLHFAAPFGLADMDISPDGTWLAIGSLGIHRIDAETGESIGNLLLPPDNNHYAFGIDISPDGTMFVSSAWMDGRVFLWDVGSGQPVSEFSVDAHRLGWTTFSPDGETVAVASCAARDVVGECRQGDILLYDVATGEIVQRFVGHTERANGLAFSPDGTVLASAGVDATIRLWDVGTGQPIGEPISRPGCVNTVAFSPDGKILASGGGCYMQIDLWDVETLEPIGSPLLGHTGSLWNIIFSADGRTLYSSALDYTIRLWDVETGQPIGFPLTDHTDGVAGLALSPDGSTLFSSSMDGTVRAWDLDFDRLRARACAIAGRNLTQAEWARYLPDVPYEVTCEQWPAGE
jgi:WD40 repeat protein